MKILLAPNAFKESLSAVQVARILGDSLEEALPDSRIERVPLADGGDGTLEVLVELWKGSFRTIATEDPLRRPIEAEVGLSADGKSAIIEMARISGLALLAEEEKDPTKTTTYGLGLAVREVLSWGINRLYLGIGGSATNDGGVGMGEALGFRHLDGSGNPVDPVGGRLPDIARILPPTEEIGIGKVEVSVFSDVTNPLCGQRGASRVFGPQKGATPGQVEFLDRGLEHLSKVWERDLGRTVAELPGAGAAGGLGAGTRVYLDAELVPGADTLLELTDLERRIAESDWVITGEGALDRTTLEGKLPGKVARLAKERGIPCIGIYGVLDRSAERDLLAAGFAELVPLASEEIPLDLRKREAARFLRETGLLLGDKLKSRS